MMRPLPAIAVAVVVAALVSVAAPASAETTCAYDVATQSVSVVSDDATILLAAPGGTITYQAFSLTQPTPAEAPCGPATTSNTESITVTGSGEEGILILLVDGSRGLFAPGVTMEPSGTSEIEIHFEPSVPGAALYQGTEGADLLRFGSLGGTTNADDDADITLGGQALGFGFSGLGGDDDLAATGGLGTGEPATLFLTAIGGAGNDLIVGGLGGDGLAGAGGNDRILGNGGADSLEGGAGKDVLSGGPGGDSLVGGGGRDTLNGGPKRDLLNGGGGSDRCVGGPGKDLIDKCER